MEWLKTEVKHTHQPPATSIGDISTLHVNNSHSNVRQLFALACILTRVHSMQWTFTTFTARLNFDFVTSSTICLLFTWIEPTITETSTSHKCIGCATCVSAYIKNDWFLFETPCISERHDISAWTRKKLALWICDGIFSTINSHLCNIFHILSDHIIHFKMKSYSKFCSNKLPIFNTNYRVHNISTSFELNSVGWKTNKQWTWSFEASFYETFLMTNCYLSQCNKIEFMTRKRNS